MFTHLLPLLLPIQNLTFCLEAVLDKSPYETVALVHSSTTVDIVDNIYGQLRKDRKFAWMRINIDKYLLTEPLDFEDFAEKENVRNVFFVYFFNLLEDFFKNFRLIHANKVDYRDNHIYVVNNDSLFERHYIKILTDLAYTTGHLNSAFLLWNTSGQGFGIEAYMHPGFGESFIKMPLSGDQCGKDFYDKVFFEKPITLDQDVIVLARSELPKIFKTVATVNGKQESSIGGYDVFIADTVLGHLRTSPIYAIVDNSVLYKKMGDKTERSFFNVSQIYRYNWTILNDEDAFKIREAPSFEIISEQTNSASYMMHVKDRDLTYLYPHDMDNFIIIVPKRFKSETKYDQIFKSPLILVWAPVAAIVSIVRFIFNKIWRTDKNIADISFETFGLSLGLSFGATISSAAENFLLWCFCLGTMLSGMLLSSEMFRGFAMQHDILTINNLKDLETSGLIVYMPFFIEPVESFFTNTPYTLKLIPESSYDIAVMIETRNTENAYVIEESKFNFLFGNDKDIWHVVERFGYHHLSYKLLRLWHLENRMNTLVQRCVEHGIDKYLKEKNKRLLSGIKHREETKDKELLSTNVKSLSLSDMTNSFLLGALGLLLSAVTFAAEKICFAIRNRKRRLNK